MKTISAFLLITVIPVYLFAQHGTIHHKIRQNIKNDSRETQEQKAEEPVEEFLDRLDKRDSAGRAMVKPFPTVHVTTRIEFPDKPTGSYFIDSYLKGYEISITEQFDDAKRNRYKNDRTLINYKTGKMIALKTDKKGNKEGMECNLQTVNWAINGLARNSSRDYRDGKNTIYATREFKVIAGHTCRKYIKDEVMATTEFWMADDLGLDASEVAGPMLVAFSGAGAADASTINNYNSGIKGFPVQIVCTPKSRMGSICIITFLKIEKDETLPAAFSTAGYDIKPLPTLRDIWNARDE